MSNFEHLLKCNKTLKKGSLIKSIDTFQKSMTLMNSTVMVPTRLKDININGVSCIKCYDNNQNNYNSVNRYCDVIEEIDENDNDDYEDVSREIYEPNLYDAYCTLNDMHKEIKGDNNFNTYTEPINGMIIKESIPIDSMKLILSHHVQQMSLLLQQLTKEANKLTSYYISNIEKELQLENNRVNTKRYYTCTNNNSEKSESKQ